MKWFLVIALSYVMTCSAIENEKYWKIRYDKRGIPLVDVMILNKKHTLMLDTGSSSGLHLELDGFNKLKNYESSNINDGGVRRFIDITGMEKKVSSINISQLEISNMYFHDFEVVNLKPWGLAIGDELPNSEVIGLGMFKNKIVMMDFENNRIEILHYLPRDIDAWSLYSVNKEKSGLVINAMIEKKLLRFIIDTAASHSIIFESKLPDKAKLLGCNVFSPDLLYTDCKVVEFYMKNRMSRVIKSPAMIVSSIENDEIDFDGLLGMTYLKNKVIIIDLPKNNLYIKN
ncbi:hypothetical protein REJ26_001326 [Providencia stuartii]|uniref:hypothetical protein n=1 Tax=Providencia TaxID=586 RepID=UPI0027FC75C2|nr:hypothetical protein [Providencia sp. 2023EL-00965]ELR5299577.1 hypothetical protein [Providencia stuartii]MDW7588652.1 hypothetical protein [Providencia sp. 2023EL-00965]